MAGLKTIIIYTEDIIQDTPYMKDKHGRLDLLGQILKTGYNLPVHDRIKSPAHMGVALHPFSEWVRDHAHNTPLTLQLLRNSSLPGDKQVNEANILLEPYDIYLETA